MFWCLVQELFCESDILRTWHFANVKFCEHVANVTLCALRNIMRHVAWHCANLTLCVKGQELWNEPCIGIFFYYKIILYFLPKQCLFDDIETKLAMVDQHSPKSRKIILQFSKTDLLRFLSKTELRWAWAWNWKSILLHLLNNAQLNFVRKIILLTHKDNFITRYFESLIFITAFQPHLMRIAVQNVVSSWHLNHLVVSK